MQKNLPLFFSLGSVVLFFLSLTQDCYFTDRLDSLTPGWALLLTGWIGFLYGYFTWFANPLLFLSWIGFFRKNFQLSFLASLGAILVMLSFLLYDKIVTSEAPNYSLITGYGLGYWLWVASAFFLFAANILSKKIR
ncbi:MAG: hypothetical protein FDX18_10545 [Chlorobium sp.]|nr:MAG: hypothetical protein FDX18_10545 [Chlorobium sp.]